LTAANCTCSIWEGFADTMRNVAQWKRWFADNADLITPVRTAADIGRAKAAGKSGIILGFQNTSAFEDQLGYIELFKELGVGVVQITYNTQNLSGAGCYERRDTGLSGFGHEVVAEMNRVGILCDLSHVGAATSYSRRRNRSPIRIFSLPRSKPIRATNPTRRSPLLSSTEALSA
jgi:membrane dipeptidase